jgi:hypothetical protein
VAAVTSREPVALRLVRDACAYALSDDRFPDEAAAIVRLACHAARETGLELPGFPRPQASPPAAIPGVAWYRSWTMVVPDRSGKTSPSKEARVLSPRK